MKKLPIAGFVLAGGQSSRMGQNKALLQLDGQTLIERAVHKLDIVCESVAIAGGSAELQPFGKVLPDKRPGCGPLSGIVAALASSEAEWCLFLPVDVPLVPVDFLRELSERALASSASAVVPRTSEWPQPLCAAYHRNILPGLQKALAEDLYKVMAAVERSGKVEVFEIKEHVDWFTNANTPEEFSRMQDALRRPND